MYILDKSYNIRKNRLSDISQWQRDSSPGTYNESTFAHNFTMYEVETKKMKSKNREILIILVTYVHTPPSITQKSNL